ERPCARKTQTCAKLPGDFSSTLSETGSGHRPQANDPHPQRGPRRVPPRGRVGSWRGKWHRQAVGLAPRLGPPSRREGWLADSPDQVRASVASVPDEGPARSCDLLPSSREEMVHFNFTVEESSGHD